MPPDTFSLNETLTFLKRTPATLSSLLAPLPDRWLLATEGEGEWSPHQTLIHLIHGEHTNWLPRVRHILNATPGPFPPFDRTVAFDTLATQDITTLLEQFATLRAANVADLERMALTDTDLERTGLHPEFGEVYLHQLLATWVVHDLNHLNQIVRTLAKVYREAVGPWRAYLLVLEERA